MDGGAAPNNVRTPSGPTSSQSANSSPSASYSNAPLQQTKTNGYGSMAMGMTQTLTSSPVAERRSFDRNSPRYASIEEGAIVNDMSDGFTLGGQTTAILIRRLPSSMSNEALRSMLLFAEDFFDVRFTSTDSMEDSGFLTAIARFRTMEGASEARNRLNGRPNATNEANMIVDLQQTGSIRTLGARRMTSDGPQNARQLSTSASSGSSNGGLSRQPSRYSGTFQSMDKISPSKIHSNSVIGDGRIGDSTSPPRSFFVPQSPQGLSVGADRARISGKSVINDDVDDDTGELLRDPVAFARSDHGGSAHRQAGLSPVSVARLANLHLSTDGQGVTDGMVPSTGFGSSRTMQPLQSPISEFTTNGGMAPMSPTGLYQMPSQFNRTHYPPANPADQNPPCNTLYVGNLPVDASEDELKALFSKQRGYKRLCFRTKHNGPMCFVEFEDITFATKALNELYGTMLHNSIKGGIRLSFSKNPLGVRTGQGNGMGPTSPLGSPGSAYGNGVGVPPGFSSNGPPPGLAVPPGLSSPMSLSSPPSNLNAASAKFFAPSNMPLSPGSMQYGMRGQASSTGYGMNMPNGFPDYMLGR